MSINVECMKHFTLSKKENEPTYELLIDSSDFVSTEWDISRMNAMSQYLKEYIPNQTEVLLLLPMYLGLSNYDHMFPEDHRFFTNLSSPEICLSILEKYDVIEKSKQTNPIVTSDLEWLKNHWMQGYSIVFNGSIRASTV